VAVIRWTSRSAATSRPVLAALAVAGVALAGCAAGQQAQTANQHPTVDGANVSVGSIAVRDVVLEYPASGVYEQGGDARLTMVVVNGGSGSDVLVEVLTDAAEEVTLSAAGPGSGGATPEPSQTSIGPSSTPTGTASGTPTGTREPETPSASAGTGEPSDQPTPTASGSGSPAPSPEPSGSAGAEPTGEPAARIPIPANGLVAFRDDGPVVQLVGLTRKLLPAQLIRVTLVFQNAGRVEIAVPVGVPRGEISLAPTVPGGEERAEAGE